MAKFGVTLRTTSHKAPLHDQVHNVPLCKDMDFYAASKLFNQLAYTLRLLKGRTASVTHSRGSCVTSLEWHVQRGEPGDDLCIFIDTYEDEE